jgi:hypothetical protein
LSEPAAKKLKDEEGNDAPAPVLSEPVAKMSKIERGSDLAEEYQTVIEKYDAEKNYFQQTLIPHFLDIIFLVSIKIDPFSIALTCTLKS